MGSRSVRFFGKLISLAAIVSAALLMVNICTTKMFPGKYMLAAAIVLVLLLLLITDLTWNFKSRSRFFFGFVLGALVSAASVMGTIYISRTVDTAKEITSTTVTETVQIGVYVKEENRDDFESVASGYQYAIAKEDDRENTDQAVHQLKDAYAPSKPMMEYDSVTQLVKALRDGETDAILMNTIFFAALEDVEGFEEIGKEIRLVRTFDVETVKDEEPPRAILTDAINSGYTGNAFTVYICGVDTRSPRFEEKSRSDVNILAAVNPDTHQILLISTPRDYYVELSITDGEKDKLTHAGFYGLQVSSDTVGMIYNVKPDYYFRVNFFGFKKIIDSLGGVTVYSDNEFTSSSKAGGNYHFRRGDNTLNGEAALAFCRERKAFIDGDRQRGKNQMEVIRAVIRRMMSVNLLTNYTRVLEAVKGSFETSMPYDKISELVRGQLEDAAEWNIVSYGMTGSDAREQTYTLKQSLYVMIPDELCVNTARALIRQVYEDKVISEAEAAAEAEALTKTEEVTETDDSLNSSESG